jgi:hypothetical protein
MKRNELFVTVSILVSIISLIFLNKALNKIQCTNHLTFKECGKKGGRKEKRGGRKEKRGGRKEKRGGRKEERRGRKEKTTHCPPLVYRRRTDNTKKNTIIRYLYIVYKVKLSLTDFVFKKRSSACTVLLFISIDFIYLLDHFICIYSLGTQSLALLIKSQHMQCTNHLTFNECGKKGGV